MDTHQVHDLEDTMGNPAGTRYGYLNIGQAQPKINVNEFPETSLFIHPVEFKKTRPGAICHHPVVSTHYSRKKAKTNDALTIIMLQAFIIHQPDLFVQYCSQEFLIMGLFLFCVR